MKTNINTLFDYIKTLPEADLDRVISFVLGIVSSNQQPQERPDCPYCSGTSVIKYGHRNGKQRFLCQDCKRTYLYTTHTIMANSHYGQSVWKEFILDTLSGKTLDDSAQSYGFSHQTAFHMRHKVLLAFQDLLEQDPVLLSGIVEMDETFVLDCYKGGRVPKAAGRKARKHGAKAAKRGISKEYIAICTGIQRDGGVVVASTNRAKPPSQELCEIFQGHLEGNTLVLTDGLRSYPALKTLAECTIVDVNQEERGGVFHLNTVNSLHSFIKQTYRQYRGVATKYLNRYNALFSLAFRCGSLQEDRLFSSLCTMAGSNCY